MSITNRHKGFTLLEVIISLGISMSLLLIIIKVNSEVINDYCSNSKESILEDNFDNAMLNLDNIIKSIDLVNGDDIDLKFLKQSIIELKLNLDRFIDLEKVDMISKMVYDLNVKSNFSQLTDYISNEFYSFEYLLQEKIKIEKHNLQFLVVFW